RNAHAQCSERTVLNLQLVTRQLTICPKILFAGPSRNVLGEGGRGRQSVPTNFFEVIPYILPIVRILRFARLIAVGRPETGRIWCEDFIGQSDPLTGQSEFKLCVGDDDAALPRVIGGLFV